MAQRGDQDKPVCGILEDLNKIGSFLSGMLEGWLTRLKEKDEITV